MTFENQSELAEILAHARSKPRCVIEFTTEDGATTVAEITEHVAVLETNANTD